jgi:hypothetical protein
MAMLDHADHNGAGIYPGLKLVAWKTGYQLRQVQRIVRDLETAGILEVTCEATQHRPTEYRAHLDHVPRKPPHAGARDDKMSSLAKPRDDKKTPLKKSRDDKMSRLDASRGDILRSRDDIAMSSEPSMRLMDGWMDGESRKSETVPPPPPAELYAQHPGWAIGGPLPAHPQDLWRNACPSPTAAHADSLAALAAEHDAATDGHGWYWVGRAILAGTTAQASIGHPNYLRNTLIRWRDEDSYGSDRARPAKEMTDGPPRPRAVGSRPRRAAVEAARPAPHLGGGSAADDLTDEELKRIEDAAGAEFRRRAAERNA